MEYVLLKFVHVLGAILLGDGLISVWLSDMRSRQLRGVLVPQGGQHRNKVFGGD